MSERDNFLTRRLAQRYADDTDFQKRIDRALGVYHVPFCAVGICLGCDKERIRREVAALREAKQ
jgi:hypothetical protein